MQYIKQNRKTENNKLIHEDIFPANNKDLETSLNKFLNDNQENFEYNMDKLNKRTSQNKPIPPYLLLLIIFGDMKIIS